MDKLEEVVQLEGGKDFSPERCAFQKEQVQLEFPFTKKGFMQQRAISQDMFLQRQYNIYADYADVLGFDKLSYDDYMSIKGDYFMKVFRTYHPYRSKNLI
jgi:hypothetical protein